VHWEWLALKRSPSAEFERLGKVFLQSNCEGPLRNSIGAFIACGRLTGTATLSASSRGWFGILSSRESQRRKCKDRPHSFGKKPQDLCRRTCGLSVGSSSEILAPQVQ
jgi:hypothetical protein